MRIGWVFDSSRTFPSSRVIFYDRRLEYESYDKLPADCKFTDEQTLFCPSAIRCFDIVSQESPIISIACLKPVKWNKTAIDQLVLREDKKEMICCLLENHGKSSTKGLANVVPGKGAVSNHALLSILGGLTKFVISQGLVFVLYGPPGVGKTLTAGKITQLQN